ncbi:MAG: hypothetical protein ACLVL7_01870 [Anaerotruncus massiliensis (ex Togo et al. 2019)]
MDGSLDGMETAGTVSEPEKPSAPAEESKPDGEQPPESGSASGESPSEERRHNEDDKGSTDEYSLTATQEEVFTEDGLAVEITAVSTFPFTRNLHIEAKDGGKAEGATEGAEKVTGDPEAASSETSGPEENGSEASGVPEESTSSEAASSEAGSVPEVSSAPEESASSEESKPEETPESGKPEENGKPGGAEDSSNPISELAEAAASARINLARVLSAEITAEEIVPLPESSAAESKPESKPEDPTADTGTGEEKAPAPDGSSSENPAPGGESEAASSSGAGPEDTGSENAGSDVNSDASSSEASGSEAASSDSSNSDSSGTDETMSEGRVTVNGEGEPFRFQRKFTVTKNGTYVIRIHDGEGPLEERSFYTEVEVTSLGELTAEIAPGSNGQYEVAMASTYPGTERFTVEFVPAVRAMARSRSAEPAEGEAVELPVEDVTVKSGEENGHEENAPSEVTEASTAVPASADGVYTVRAFRGENLLRAAAFSAPAATAAESSLETVYWNPDPAFQDVDQTIPGGNDDAAGNSALASVKTLEQALWLVQPNGTIVCMSMCSDTYHKEEEGDASTYTFDGKNATIKRWNKYLSGPYFYIDKGVNLSLTNLTLSNTTESGGSAADSVVTLADGTLTAGAGLTMGGPVYFEQRPTAPESSLHRRLPLPIRSNSPQTSIRLPARLTRLPLRRRSRRTIWKVTWRWTAASMRPRTRSGRCASSPERATNGSCRPTRSSPTRRSTSRGQATTTTTVRRQIRRSRPLRAQKSCCSQN